MFYSFLLLMCIFLWMGFVGAISFMESWLKFRAAGITIPLGLNIGKLVFSALNKVEWVFAIASGILLFSLNELRNFPLQFYFGIPVLILLIQTFWLLPTMHKRAIARIKGENVSKSYLHFYFVIAEFVKVFTLFLLAFAFYRLKF